MPSRRTSRLRHARYYQQICWQSENLYHEGNEKLLQGLALFDRERRQIDAGWGWAMAQPHRDDTNRLLLDFANATAYVGSLRYDLRRERIPQLEAQRDAAQRLGEYGAEGSTLGNLGVTYEKLGEYHRAIEHHQQALVISRKIGNRRGEGSTLGNLGNAYNNLGEYHRAIEYHQQNLTIAREIGARHGEGSALGNLGGTYANLGEYQHAIEHHEQALVISREIDYQRGEGTALEALGVAYHNLDETSKALHYYNQAKDIWQATGDVASTARLSWNLGTLYEQQGDLSRAVPLMQVLVDFWQQIGHLNYEKDAARLESVKHKLAGGGQRPWWQFWKK
jgi:tetratricopeptide (TPR) repeat protein